MYERSNLHRILGTDNWRIGRVLLSCGFQPGGILLLKQVDRVEHFASFMLGTVAGGYQKQDLRFRAVVLVIEPFAANLFGRFPNVLKHFEHWRILWGRRLVPTQMSASGNSYLLLSKGI
jgi:hypothetical protein